jgi:hypothetical protein
LESSENLCGSLARRQIVVACVKDHDWRLVRNYDALRELRHIARLRSSKAAIQYRDTWEVAAERRPHPDRGAADEDDASQPRRLRPILGLESSDVRLPVPEGGDSWRTVNRILTNNLRRASQQPKDDE